jgi:hypothetical protein
VKRGPQRRPQASEEDGWQPIAAEAQNLRMAQVDVQLRRDRYRHRRGSDPTGNVLTVRALLLHRPRHDFGRICRRVLILAGVEWLTGHRPRDAISENGVAHARGSEREPFPGAVELAGYRPRNELLVA